MPAELAILFASGCAGGLLSGLLGIGGGVIYVVVFQTWLEAHTEYASYDEYFVQVIILNSLVAIIFSAIAGLFRQSRHGKLQTRSIFTTGMAAAVAALISTAFIASQDWYQRDTFLAVFTLLLLPLLLRLLPAAPFTPRQSVNNLWLISSGALAGVATALSGLGGGIVLHPLLHGLGKLDMRRTLPLALGVMLFSASAIVLFYIYWGYIPLGVKGILPEMVVPVAVGNILFAPLGVKLSHSISIMAVKRIFLVSAAVLLARNIYLLFT